MFSIGEFAKLGRVSVRMLRHYDAIGLLTPADVDPHSGYRFYTADQLPRLNRVLALTDLGFGLKQIARLIGDPDQLHEMLRLRRSELVEQVRAATGRLAGVEARLRLIESEDTMVTVDVVVKAVPQARVVALDGLANSFEPGDIGPVVGPLCGTLAQRMQDAGLRFAGPAVAWYEPTEDDRVHLWAGAPYTGSPQGSGLDTLVLPAMPRAATVVHHGDMASIVESYQALAHWIEDSGDRAVTGHSREVYLHTDGDQRNWVTELQMPIEG